MSPRNERVLQAQHLMSILTLKYKSPFVLINNCQHSVWRHGNSEKWTQIICHHFENTTTGQPLTVNVNDSICAVASNKHKGLCFFFQIEVNTF